MTKISYSLMFTALLTIAAGCSKSTQQKSSNVVQNVEVMTLKKQMIEKTLEFPSVLESKEEVNLVPAQPAKIDQILVKIGDHVKQGQLVVKMDPTQLITAQIQFNNLEKDMERVEALRKSGTITQQSYDQTRSQYDLNKTNLKYMEKNVNLRSPISGVVTAKNYEDQEMYSGSPVGQSGKAAIITIDQLNPLKVLVDIPESYLPQLSVGMKVSISTDVFPNKTFPAHIIRIYPTIDQSTLSVKTEVDVLNGQELLRPGMFCRVTIDLGKVNALVVPYQAVLKLQGSDERYVFLNQNGRSKRVIVKLGKRFNDQTEIISDQIKEGDQLVVVGQNRLIGGDSLHIVH
ncbi:MAG: efflux RND transporter periplasmic adaptor subunit [Microbacter sp.]